MIRYFLQAKTIPGGCLALAFLFFSLGGCVIPVPKTAVPAATSRPSISDPMLTAAAKTIVADLQALNTLAADTVEPDQRAMSVDLSPPGLASPQPEFSTEPPLPTVTLAATTTFEQPIIAQAATVTPLPQPTATFTAPPSSTPPPTAAPLTIPATAAPPPIVAPTEAAIGQIPPVSLAPAPPIPFHAPIHEYGEQFAIKEILVSACANGAWTVFRILNQSQDKLESLSLHIQDLSSGAVLTGPWTSNTPFQNEVQNCAVGYLDLLNTGREMFLSQMPGTNGLSGHRLRATIKLCAKEDLTGECTQKAVEFIIP